MSSIVDGDVARNRRTVAEILTSTWHACTEPDDETKASFTAEVIISNPPAFGHIHCAERLQIPLHIMFTMPGTPTTAFPHPLSNITSSVGPTEKINFYSYDVVEMLVSRRYARQTNDSACLLDVDRPARSDQRFSSEDIETASVAHPSGNSCADRRASTAYLRVFTIAGPEACGLGRAHRCLWLLLP